MNSSDLHYNKSLRSTCSGMRGTTAAPSRTTPYAPYMYPVYSVSYTHLTLPTNREV